MEPCFGAKRASDQWDAVNGHLPGSPRRNHQTNYWPQTRLRCIRLVLRQPAAVSRNHGITISRQCFVRSPTIIHVPCWLLRRSLDLRVPVLFFPTAQLYLCVPVWNSVGSRQGEACCFIVPCQHFKWIWMREFVHSISLWSKALPLCKWNPTDKWRLLRIEHGSTECQQAKLCSFKFMNSLCVCCI